MSLLVPVRLSWSQEELLGLVEGHLGTGLEGVHHNQWTPPSFSHASSWRVSLLSVSPERCRRPCRRVEVPAAFPVHHPDGLDPRRVYPSWLENTSSWAFSFGQSLARQLCRSQSPFWLSSTLSSFHMIIGHYCPTICFAVQAYVQKAHCSYDFSPVDVVPCRKGPLFGEGFMKSRPGLRDGQTPTQKKQF